ncbi:hypothetical protein NDU88_003347 [Pleurodeles waltl]|uniref:Uncharacterized protein n=1 Tax=Pleurodeles waltl TaxID=8319 RepID=A0AAV7W527_PLEWA|nr:hypothetical protein NDU88_003347 [Pleurodeles waltl]
MEWISADRAEARTDRETEEDKKQRQGCARAQTDRQQAPGLAGGPSAPEHAGLHKSLQDRRKGLDTGEVMART